MKKTIYAAFALAVCAGALFGRPFELYQPIIDRCPFGEGPDDPSVPPEQAAKGSSGKDAKTDAEVSKEQEQLEKAVRVSVISINPDGRVMVGFSDLSDPKHPLHYYMAAGEARSDWLVKEADPKTKEVTLVKGGAIEIVRKLGENSTAAAKAGAKDARTPPAAARPRVSPMLGRASMRGARLASEENARRAAEELEAERRKEREEAERRRAEEKQEREEERAEMLERLNTLKADMERQRKEARERQEQEMRERQESEGAGEND